MTRPLITLTTDFGTGSPYVAQLKGVLLSICREADVIDISHAIGPQNIREGAIVLGDVTPRFPVGTIHLAVIDPGVGTSRRMVYAEIGPQRYIAPDNGLLSCVASARPPATLIAIENPNYWLPTPSSTFHGRDIMGPVAAHLACGLNPTKLGPRLNSIVSLDWPAVRKSSSSVAGEVLYVDAFGNLITNIEATDAQTLGEPASLIVDCGGRTIRGIIPTYGAAMEGEIVALLDSQGRLEVAKVNGSAARELHCRVGDMVTVSGV